MLRQRIVTAIVLAVCFLTALFGLSPPVFTAVMALVVGYAGWEMSALAGISDRLSRLVYVAAMLIVMGLLTGWLDFDKNSLFTSHVRSLLGWTCIWWTIALLWIQSYPGSAILWGRRGFCVVIGFVVLVPTWMALAALVHAENGAWLILGVVLLVALADIGAFFTGRAFGRHKLATKVSPGKTWEGVGGGLLAVTLGVTLFSFLRAEGTGQWWAWLLLAGVTGLASVVGDLFESMFKRHSGVKDSGTILPGHGGVLDRIDGLTAALPVFALLYVLLHTRL
ncbi:MAG: phosphatidate cytidylyltransferase [Gammaproteobacteria bacterium]|nr:MAG: phosphatidate cytidylyltransferase [Gammaproteobacteria bacterium]RLA54654.1 MAG: phosphatidate cytidylyltransferase [Gammaproteobacteria bacterium]